MKAYVWANFAPDYTDGLAVVIANSPEEAEAILARDYGHYRGEGWSSWGECKEYSLDESQCWVVTGGS